MTNTLQQDMKTAERLATYNVISTELALLSDLRLSSLLEKAVPLGSSICGVTSRIEIDGMSVFVKKIRLTDIEIQITQGGEVAESACTMVEKNLHTITSFINSHGILHFDAHFWNILTDGQNLYFSDFGLVISDRFELSQAELDFFKQHHNYDRCYTMAFFVEYILRESFGGESYDTILQEFITRNSTKKLPSAIAEIVTRYAPMTAVMNKFHRILKTESKDRPYPVDELELLSY